MAFSALSSMARKSAESLDRYRGGGADGFNLSGVILAETAAAIAICHFIIFPEAKMMALSMERRCFPSPETEDKKEEHARWNHKCLEKIYEIATKAGNVDNLCYLESWLSLTFS